MIPGGLKPSEEDSAGEKEISKHAHQYDEHICLKLCNPWSVPLGPEFSE